MSKTFRGRLLLLMPPGTSKVRPRKTLKNKLIFNNSGFRGPLKMQKSHPRPGNSHIPRFRMLSPTIFGIIACNQNSHSRPGNSRDCDFLAGQNHRSIRQFKFKLISGNASKTNGFSTILARRAIGSMHRSPTHHLATMVRSSHARRSGSLRFAQ